MKFIIAVGHCFGACLMVAATTALAQAPSPAQSPPAVEPTPNQPTANWTKFDADNDSSDYIDRSTISKKGNYKKAWFMTSWTLPQSPQDASKPKYKSDVGLFYFNCTDHEMALVSLVTHVGEFGTGEASESFFPPKEHLKFIEPPPKTRGTEQLRLVCESK